MEASIDIGAADDGLLQSREDIMEIPSLSMVILKALLQAVFHDKRDSWRIPLSSSGVESTAKSGEDYRQTQVSVGEEW